MQISFEKLCISVENEFRATVYPAANGGKLSVIREIVITSARFWREESAFHGKG